MQNLIYMDNAATTAVRKEVLDKMLPYYTDMYCNPSAPYSFAEQGMEEVNNARKIIADTLNADPSEIFFTGGGSESDNWALKSIAEKYSSKGKHIITSSIEHHAILHTAQYLEKLGYEVTYLPVDEEGKISLTELEAAIRPDTILISIMAANNEIGTVQPIAEIGALAKSKGVLFHTDAVQAYCHIPMDVKEMNIDLLSASGHKFNGPKGVGFLYVKKGTKIGAFIHGGSQERGRRAGTTNVPGIVGMAEAARINSLELEETMKAEIAIRDHILDRISEEIPYVKINGSRVDRLPNNVNASFRFIEGESMIIFLDQAGICASSGSACTSGSLDPSHVLLAIGLPHEIAHGSLRLSISKETTLEQADYVVDKLKGIIDRLRQMSPLYEDFVKNQK